MAAVNSPAVPTGSPPETVPAMVAVFGSPVVKSQRKTMVGSGRVSPSYLPARMGVPASTTWRSYGGTTPGMVNRPSAPVTRSSFRCRR